VRITKQPSGGRGEYEIANAWGRIRPVDLLSRALVLRVGDIEFATGVELGLVIVDYLQILKYTPQQGEMLSRPQLIGKVAESLKEAQRPQFWNRLWERDIDSLPDYKSLGRDATRAKIKRAFFIPQSL